jgi:hypothetical protein
MHELAYIVIAYCHKYNITTHRFLDEGPHAAFILLFVAL